jgi:hypothetical protein
LTFFWAIGLTTYCTCAVAGCGDNDAVAHNESAKESVKESVKAVSRQA